MVFSMDPSRNAQNKTKERQMRAKQLRMRTFLSVAFVLFRPPNHASLQSRRLSLHAHHRATPCLPPHPRRPRRRPPRPQPPSSWHRRARLSLAAMSRAVCARARTPLRLLVCIACVLLVFDYHRALAWPYHLSRTALIPHHFFYYFAIDLISPHSCTCQAQGPAHQDQDHGRDHCRGQGW